MPSWKKTRKILTLNAKTKKEFLFLLIMGHILQINSQKKIIKDQKKKKCPVTRRGGVEVLIRHYKSSHGFRPRSFLLEITILILNSLEIFLSIEFVYDKEFPTNKPDYQGRHPCCGSEQSALPPTALPAQMHANRKPIYPAQIFFSIF